MARPFGGRPGRGAFNAVLGDFEERIGYVVAPATGFKGSEMTILPASLARPSAGVFP